MCFPCVFLHSSTKILHNPNLQPHQKPNRPTNLFFRTKGKLLVRSFIFLAFRLRARICLCVCVPFRFRFSAQPNIFTMLHAPPASLALLLQLLRLCGCHILKKKLCDSLYLLEDSLCLQLNHTDITKRFHFFHVILLIFLSFVGSVSFVCDVWCVPWWMDAIRFIFIFAFWWSVVATATNGNYLLLNKTTTREWK